jgi:hypothetical protein
MGRAERKQSSPCFRQLPNYQQSAANLVQGILARCFRSRNKCRLLGNAPHDLSVCFVPAPALGGQAKSTRAIEGSQITSAMLLPADKASCARAGEGTVVEVNTEPPTGPTANKGAVPEQCAGLFQARIVGRNASGGAHRGERVCFASQHRGQTTWGLLPIIFQRRLALRVGVKESELIPFG